MSNTITDLANTQQINDSDLLVVSQQDRYLCNKFNSCALSASSLIDMLFDTVLSMQNLKDTAYMTSSEFSLYDHNHNSLYNKVSCEFAYASQSTYQRLSSLMEYCSFNNTINDSDSISIGNVFIDGTLVPIDVPLSAITDVKKIRFSLIEPEVGTLKFVASANPGTNSSIEYKSSSFDGWMYPDGSIYQLSDFALSAKLKALYGNSDQKTFTLPCLSNFLKLNGKNQKSNSSAIAECHGKNVLMKHAHSVNALCDIDTFVQLRMPGNPGAGNGGTLHRGDGKVFIFGPQRTQFKYGNDSYNFLNLIKELGITANVTGGYNSEYEVEMRIDKVKTLLQTIDKYNKSSLYNEFIKKNILKLNPVGYIKITAQLNIDNDIDIKVASVDGDTYPSHVILPVMIYVGQRKRDLI